MNRTQFLSLFAIPFLPKVDLPEKDKCPFNVELIQKRIDYLKAHPPEHILEPDGIEENSGSGALLSFKKMPSLGWIGNEIVDEAEQPFYITERVVGRDGSGWIRVRPFQYLTYLKGRKYAIVRTALPEGT